MPDIGLFIDSNAQPGILSRTGGGWSTIVGGGKVDLGEHMDPGGVGL